MNAKIRGRRVEIDSDAPEPAPAGGLGGPAETVDFFHIIESGRDRPEGSHDMPSNTPQGQHRYTFTSGSRPLEGYTIKRAIGRGGFGEVYYATSDSGKEVALKLITRNLDIERRGVVQCMNLKCPHLLAIHDIKSNDSGDTFVIMEYVAGPSLAGVVARHPDGMPLNEVRAWLKGLVEGVTYLHDHGIVHRDLKSANVFMEEGVVKIGDYGLSKMISGPQSHHSESIGTCHYMAPEIASGRYNKPIDIYALGVILFEMITGRLPFEGETVNEVLCKHLTTRPDLSGVPEPFRAIIAKALSKDPAHRQVRVVDLLPPEDAPRPRDVRFIGEGKVSPPSDPARPEGPARDRGRGRPDDDVLRITDEESVLYIGPDTPTPRLRGAAFAPWNRPARRPQPQPRPQARPIPIPPPRPAPRSASLLQQVRLVASVPLRPVEPAPLPVPLPSGRIRVAELAGSMFVAAPWAALASLVAGGFLQVDLATRPQDLGYLFAMALLSSWTVLAAQKAGEGRTIDPLARRLAQLALGAGLGLIGQLLAGWFLVGPPDGGTVLVQLPWMRSGTADGVDAILGSAAFFGLVGLAVDWGTLAERDRRARFRFLPILKAGLLALIPGVLVFPPDAHPYAIPAVMMTAIVVQLASPWSEAGSRYIRFLEENKKARVA